MLSQTLALTKGLWKPRKRRGSAENPPISELGGAWQYLVETLVAPKRKLSQRRKCIFA